VKRKGKLGIWNGGLYRLWKLLGTCQKLTIGNFLEMIKYPNAEGEQHTGKNKLKEDLKVMWHKIRLLKMCERERLPKLTTNSKLIKLQEEINGVMEELLEEDEMDVTDINNLIYAAATIITQTLNEPGKKLKIEEM